MGLGLRVGVATQVLWFTSPALQKSSIAQANYAWLEIDEDEWNAQLMMSIFANQKRKKIPKKST